MESVENQLIILTESLDRKIEILQRIQMCSGTQAQAFRTDDSEADLEAFDRAFEEKDQLIEEMERLDDGFETLYEGLSRELQSNKDKYIGQIKALQERIARVTDLSIAIQTQETRNKKLAEDYFVKSRNGIRQNRQSSKAAYDYYKSMSGIAYSTSQIMDSKQ